MGDQELSDESKLELLWRDYERRSDGSTAQQPSTHIGSLLAKIPDRWIMWIALAIAAMGQGETGLAVLSNIIKGLK